MASDYKLRIVPLSYNAIVKLSKDPSNFFKLNSNIWENPRCNENHIMKMCTSSPYEGMI